MTHERTSYDVMVNTGKQVPSQNGDRLVELNWKTNTKTGKKAHSSRVFSMPMYRPDLAGGDEAFLPMLVDAMHSAQKAKAHEYVTMLLDSGQVEGLVIPVELVEPDAILADFLESDSEDGSRGKLSGEQIKTWFDALLSDTVQTKLAMKKGWLEESHTLTDAEAKQLAQASSQYKAVLVRLAAPSPNVDVATAKMLRSVVCFLGEPSELDSIGRKLVKKLDVIINPPAEKVPAGLMDIF